MPRIAGAQAMEKRLPWGSRFGGQAEALLCFFFRRVPL